MSLELPQKWPQARGRARVPVTTSTFNAGHYRCHDPFALCEQVLALSQCAGNTARVSA